MGFPLRSPFRVPHRRDPRARTGYPRSVRRRAYERQPLEYQFVNLLERKRRKERGGERESERRKVSTVPGLFPGKFFFVCFVKTRKTFTTSLSLTSNIRTLRSRKVCPPLRHCTTLGLPSLTGTETVPGIVSSPFLSTNFIFKCVLIYKSPTFSDKPKVKKRRRRRGVPYKVPSRRRTHAHTDTRTHVCTGTSTEGSIYP